MCLAALRKIFIVLLAIWKKYLLTRPAYLSPKFGYYNSRKLRFNPSKILRKVICRTHEGNFNKVNFDLVVFPNYILGPRVVILLTLLSTANFLS